jgi:hypothetical protein
MAGKGDTFMSCRTTSVDAAAGGVVEFAAQPGNLAAQFGAQCTRQSVYRH